MSAHLIVLVTSPAAEAPSLAKSLVEERLAACVNIVPGLRSYYRWEGQVEEDDEVLCILKTQAQLFEQLRQRLTELHSYEVPEIIALPIVAGNQPYLEWITASTAGKEGP